MPTRAFILEKVKSAWKWNPNPWIQSERKRERKIGGKEEFDSSRPYARVRVRVKKYGRGISAPARTAINHIISVNGACKTREGSASLFLYNTEEERNTSGRMSDRNHVLRGTRVLEVGGRASGEDREALPDVQQHPRRSVVPVRFDGAVPLWNLDRWK